MFVTFKGGATMSPGPAYNWLCVLHSAAEILAHAARYKAAQLCPAALRKHQSTGGVTDESAPQVDRSERKPAWQEIVQKYYEVLPERSTDTSLVTRSSSAKPEVQNDVHNIRPVRLQNCLPSVALHSFSTIQEAVHSLPTAVTPQASRILKPSKVPSSRIGRLFHYGGRFSLPCIDLSFTLDPW